MPWCEAGGDVDVDAGPAAAGVALALGFGGGGGGGEEGGEGDPVELSAFGGVRVRVGGGYLEEDWVIMVVVVRGYGGYVDMEEDEPKGERIIKRRFPSAVVISRSSS